MDLLGSIDPFIRFNLSTSRWQAYCSKCETSVKNNCPFSAAWKEEIFVFGIEEPESLTLELWDWDRTGTEYVGTATVNMEDIIKLMQAKFGSEIFVTVPVYNNDISIMGYDKLPCCLKVSLKLINDDKKISLFSLTQLQVKCLI